MKTMNFKFSIGQLVYLKTDPDQCQRIVTGISVRGGGLISYAMTYVCSETWHYEFEIMEEKDILKKLQ